MSSSYPSHTSIIAGTPFTTSSRYRPLRQVGAGAYGVVASAEDLAGGKVAIKKVTHVLGDLIDAKRVLREVKLMRHLGVHENVVRLVDLEPESASASSLRDLYIVTQLFDTDLHHILYSKQRLTAAHISYFVYQTMRGLKYIHSAGVLHRDLKPSNLLVNSNCDLAICDFGLARGFSPQPLAGAGASAPLQSALPESPPLACCMTEYVVTRWYRAPEVILGSHTYGAGVDVWSVGCILAELLLRKPLFAGRDYLDQLALQHQIL